MFYRVQVGFGQLETFDAAAYFVDNRKSERRTICEATDGQRVERPCDVVAAQIRAVG